MSFYSDFRSKNKLHTRTPKIMKISPNCTQIKYRVSNILSRLMYLIMKVKYSTQRNDKFLERESALACLSCWRSILKVYENEGELKNCAQAINGDQRQIFPSIAHKG